MIIVMAGGDGAGLVGDLDEGLVTEEWVRSELR